MAAASFVKGNFVNAVHKKWDGFTDNRTQETVEAGESLVVNVYTPHDGELCVVQADRKTQNIAECVALLDGLKFGDVVEVVTGKFTYGKYVGLFGVNRAKAA